MCGYSNRNTYKNPNIHRVEFHRSPFIFRRLFNCINMAKIELISNYIKYLYFKFKVIIN